MRDPFKKCLGVGVFILIVLGIIGLTGRPSEAPTIPVSEEITAQPEVRIGNEGTRQVLGTSVEGREIEAYTFGDGEKRVLFVGGVHGGYEWNSVLLAYEFMDYIKVNPEVIPQNVTVFVIPSLNPDGVYKVIGKEGRFVFEDVPKTANTKGVGRFNAHNVDLNRNFACKWKSESMWRGNPVSAGTEVFSEPESIALRDFVLGTTPAGVVFWHSQANTVYASECEEGVLPETLVLMNTYANASGYAMQASFDAYEVTGDAEGWLASIHIPAITVELKTHETVEWNENLAGIKALLEYYR